MSTGLTSGCRPRGARQRIADRIGDKRGRQPQQRALGEIGPDLGKSGHSRVPGQPGDRDEHARANGNGERRGDKRWPAGRRRHRCRAARDGRRCRRRRARTAARDGQQSLRGRLRHVIEPREQQERQQAAPPCRAPGPATAGRCSRAATSPASWKTRSRATAWIMWPPDRTGDGSAPPAKRNPGARQAKRAARRPPSRFSLS